MDAERVIAELRALDERSGGRRVAWTSLWTEERRAFMERLAADVPGVQVDQDEAGNLWAVLAGDSDTAGTEDAGRGAVDTGTASGEVVIVGSHLDCVPGGGWLDGCLGVLAAAEALRVAAAGGPRSRALALVDWADEEGSRFGHSLLGSSAACGLLDAAHAADLVDEEGRRLEDVVREHGVEVSRMHEARSRLDGAVAYVELHIEQGPVLDTEELAAAAVDGCLGVRRHERVFSGRAVHAGATPMAMRRDPVQAAARFAGELRSLAEAHEGLGTIGILRSEPATPTAVPAAVRLSTDLRHRELGALDAMAAAVAEAAARAAEAENCTVATSELWSIDPIRFDPGLVERVAALVPEGRTLTSGPLHDAAAVARAGIPTVMVFARTRGGVSHTREEDAREEDLVVAIEAFGALVADLCR